MPWAPGKSGNPKGRKAGTPNKTTGQLKEMILQALSGVGGVKYLQKQADANPSAFMTLVGKVLPLQVSGESGGPVKLIVEWQQSEDEREPGA